MGAAKNSGVFKGASANGQIVKGLAKNGIAFWKQETLHFHTVKILARANTIGATAPTNIPNFDAYVRSMYDIWMTYCDVFFRFRGTGDANFKRINLANPDGALADFYGGYTLDASGIKGNGINAYVNTNFNPSLLVAGKKYQLNDASRGCVISESFNGQIISGTSVTGWEYWYNSNANTVRCNSSMNVITSSINLLGLGLKLLSKANNNIISINKDIQQNTTIITTSLRNDNIAILKNGTQFSTLKISTFFVGKSIPFEVSQLMRSAENADMANLGISQIA